MSEILGIKFYNSGTGNLFDALNNSGGLLTVPAAPALVTIPKDKPYYDSLIHSDYVIADSGFMALVWNLFFKNKVIRISGLEFINYFLDHASEVKGTVLTVNPGATDARINTEFLKDKGIKTDVDLAYEAPFYKESIQDELLLKMIETQKPNWVIINIGGGTQEKLGLYIRQNLSYKPAIICTGAALAFKTGRQVKVSSWMDKLYIGWLARCIAKPKMYIPRYMSAFKLISLLFKYKNKQYKYN
jgi:UDP-N-acetyl-D-mannosaminuronic acid transferase (WecB/TagA/CpsF family)